MRYIQKSTNQARSNSELKNVIALTKRETQETHLGVLVRAQHAA
jgi:hypothetical protein